MERQEGKRKERKDLTELKSDSGSPFRETRAKPSCEQTLTQDVMSVHYHHSSAPCPPSTLQAALLVIDTSVQQQMLEIGCE